jgi:signal transduction histidine kinase
MPNEKKSAGQEGLLVKTEGVPVESSSTRLEQSTAEVSAQVAHRLLALAEMTSGIAHDFRNILAIIDSGLRLAQNSDDPRAMSVVIAGVREGVARGLTLSSQLLSFAKQQEFQVCAADANELLKDLEPFLRYGAGSRVRVVLELATDVPNCVVDPSQFDTAILNLVTNARDAMPRGGEIRISTAACVVQGAVSDAPLGDYVRVRVIDDGVGMPAEVLEDIFEPFFTTKGEQGTGLGVPQVGALMRHIGGHVRVASAVGCGTTFDLYFRAVQPNGIRAHTIDLAVVQQSLTGPSRELPSIAERRAP